MSTLHLVSYHETGAGLLNQQINSLYANRNGSILEAKVDLQPPAGQKCYPINLDTEMGHINCMKLLVSHHILAGVAEGAQTWGGGTFEFSFT